MNTKTTLKSTIFFVVFFMTFTLTSQTYVDNNSGATAAFSDLQAAIDAASPNDVIYVQPSPNMYGGNTIITINKPLTIVGRSHSLENYTVKTQGILINENGSGTTLKGLETASITIKGKQSEGAGIPPVIVTNVAIINCLFSVIAIESLPYQTASVGANNILIQGCIFNRVSSGYATDLTITNSVLINSSGTFQLPTSVVFKNNMIIGTPPNFTKTPTTTTTGIIVLQNTIFLKNESVDNTLNLWDTRLENCLTYNYSTGADYDIGSSTNMQTVNMLLNTNPMFTSFTPDANITFKKDADYTLQTGSPAIGAGVNGEDLGIFAGYNFSNLGIPAGYPTINIVSSTSSLPQNGTLKVSLTAKAQ